MISMENLDWTHIVTVLGTAAIAQFFRLMEKRKLRKNHKLFDKKARKLAEEEEE